jgi:hypothetical protein
MTRCAAVCRGWQFLADDNELWRHHVLSRWGMAAKGLPWKILYAHRHVQEHVDSYIDRVKAPAPFFNTGMIPTTFFIICIFIILHSCLWLSYD